MPRAARLLVTAVAASALLSACGEEPEEVIDVGARISTAADALECAGDAEVETHSVPDGGRQAHQDAASAVRAWAERVRRNADIPADGYQVAVEEVGTVLYTHETENHAEVAVVVTRTDDPDGELGWVAESWARCGPGASGSS
jgi:hypothetical protein